MPNGGRPFRVPDAVTVLGLGGAGCRMVDAVADRASELEGGPSFEFVAVDSRREDLASLAPDEASSIHLDPPVETFEADVDSRPYLDAPTDLHPMGGVARERPTGRYLLDRVQNFDDTVSALQTALGEHAERAGATAHCTHHVWVLHALGGGTGSGIAPTVFALLDDLSGEETLVLGVGSLPRLDQLEETARVPLGDFRLYLNAYAALRELRVLFGLEGEYPHTLELGGDYGVLVSEELTVDAPPVAAYGLLGVDESRTDSDTLDALNDAVAELVCGAARSRDLLGSFLGHYPYHDETTLFTLDGSGVEVPAEELRRYAERSAEREDVADETTALAEALDRTLDGFDDRVQDRELRSIGSTTESHLSLAVADGDVEFLSDLSVQGYSFDDAVDRFDEFSVRDGTDPFALGALATFSPVDLENTSEFGTIHELHTDPDQTVIAQFGIDGGDEAVSECFAYPELVDVSAPPNAPED